ncbi:guanine(37)-N1-methyltransferase [Morchella snyderi]|nr:guanine(37)-N1-methyltransferase [Morchella snyderi]
MSAPTPTTTTSPAPDPAMSVFLPPVNRAMRTLDRSFFAKAIPLAAAHIFDAKNITHFQKECARDVLRLPRTKTIITEADPAAPGGVRKLLLLRPEVRVDDLSTAGEKTREYVESKRIELLPYTLQLNYGDWSYHEIMSAILPDTLMSEVPQSFAQAGHLAHLNLRSQYAPYKHLIAAVILDKNPRIKTVINKLEDVGTESEFRTFPMELLGGAPDTSVEVSESGCVFRFDFAKVYWNTRLGDEHERVWRQFSPGEAVCDVMAGVGPFAIPAGKRGVIVWASDLNPESHSSMAENVKRNKADAFVTPFCRDGREFIRNSARELYERSQDPATNTIVIPPPPPRSRSKVPSGPPQEQKVVRVPPTFAHYVMNLPATAIEFLDAFRGAYRGLEQLFPEGKEMPMVHVYCFNKSTEQERAPVDVCKRLSEAMGYEMRPESGEVKLEHVRVVSPNKVYYCVSFRLPREVVFAEV